MRVVHVVTRSHRRGAEVVAVELAAALDRLGHADEVHAMVLAADGGSATGLPPLVPTARLGLAAYARACWRLRRLVMRAPVDVVLAHGGAAAVVVALGVPRRRAARVWQRILGLPLAEWGLLRRAAWSVIARRFDAVAALTRELEDEVRQLGFRGPVWVIPNGRDPARFVAVDRTAAARELRAQLGIDPDVAIICFVGHLVAQKQPELAVEVLAELRRRGAPVHLVMAGDGPRRAAVEERIAATGVTDAVTLLGHRDDPELVFGGADVAVITSAAEGIPGVAIEALMTGCPVVSFPVGGVAEVVDDGITGAVVDRPEPSAMADRLAGLVADRQALRTMGAAARLRAGAFTMSAIAERYAEELTALVAERGRRRGA